MTEANKKNPPSKRKVILYIIDIMSLIAVCLTIAYVFTQKSDNKYYKCFEHCRTFSNRVGEGWAHCYTRCLANIKEEAKQEENSY